MTERVTLVLAVCLLSLWKPCLAGGDPGVHVSDGERQQQHNNNSNNDNNKSNNKNNNNKLQRACTLDEMLPRPCNLMSSEWSDDYVVEPPYDCTCAAMKARYFCPDQGGSEYPKWVPQAVASGSCASTTREELGEAPLPPNFKVLFYGNSHLRQVVEARMCMFEGAMASKRVSLVPLAVGNTLERVVEAMMCMYEEAMTSKRVTLASLDAESIVESDSQCRACFDVNKPNTISDLQRHLLDNGCIAQSDTCRCDDDNGEFFFENGAIAHYTFAHQQHDKGLKDARREHGNEPLSSYDAVFMNQGNPPKVSSDVAVETAIEAQRAGAQFFWLSTYSAGGGFNNWPEGQRARFIASGAKYLDVGCMMRGMYSWTKGAVDGSTDPHFCLPGPPNEIAVLVLKLMWAVLDGEKRPAVHQADD